MERATTPAEYLTVVRRRLEERERLVSPAAAPRARGRRRGQAAAAGRGGGGGAAPPAPPPAPPPFGHAGEQALSEELPEGFRHAEQSLRVVEKLERLNLTWGGRDAIVHHPK